MARKESDDGEADEEEDGWMDGWMDECCLTTHRHNLGHSVS